MGILDGIVEWIDEQVMNGLDLISTSVLGALGCDMGTFLRYFPAAETLYKVFVAAAIGLVLLNWVWQLFKNFGLVAGVEAEDPIRLSIRSVLFIGLIYYCDQITDMVLAIGGTPYSWILSSEVPPLNFANLNSVLLTILGVCASGSVALIALILTAALFLSQSMTVFAVTESDVITLLYKGDYYEHYLFISFWVLFMTSLRIGESAALQWSDIDFETGLLSIIKTLYYKSMNDYKFVEPKTQASVRTIYIDTDTIKELQAWREVQQKVLKDCDLLLSYNGIPTSKHTLPRALEKLAGLAGVHRIKIHALRHSHASLLISMGENPLLIIERLGHEKIQTTLGTYGHLCLNSNLEVANKLTGVLTYTPASYSIADYTSNQHTAAYHKEVE
jgi:hypothetical protein